MYPTTFVRKQLRTMCILLFLIVISMSAGLYLHCKPTLVEMTQEQKKLELEQQIEESLARFQNEKNVEKSLLNDTFETSGDQKAMLVLEGMTDAISMKSLVDILQTNQTRAFFFFTAQEVKENPHSLTLVLRAGYPVGVSGMESPYDWQDANGLRLVTNLCQMNDDFLQATSLQPKCLLANTDDLDQTLLKGTYACGYTEVMIPTQIINAQDFASQADVQKYVENLSRGSKMGVSLSSGENRMLTELSWIAQALAHTDLSGQAETLLLQNEQKMESPLQTLYTTDETVAYMFSNLENEEEVLYVLSTLASLGAKATFFVTTDEIQRQKTLVEKMIMEGHEIGVNLVVQQDDNAQKIVKDLLLARELLAPIQGDLEMKLAYLSHDEVTPALLEAVSAMQFTLIEPSIMPVTMQGLRETNVQSVYQQYCAHYPDALQRGSIVHFEMNQYRQSSMILGELLYQIHRNQNVYAAVKLSDLLESEGVYSLPSVTQASTVSMAQSTQNLSEKIKTHYIGNELLSKTETLLDFTKKEIATMNKTGCIAKQDNRVFLTFDGWTTDDRLTPLLAVLEAHGAKATFFIKAMEAYANPNLLYAVAMQGHTVAIYGEDPMVSATQTQENETIYQSLTEAETAVFQKKMVASYGMINSLIGNLVVDGQMALAPLFRPSDHVLSRMGLQAVYDCGYQYVIARCDLPEEWLQERPEILSQNLYTSTKEGMVIGLSLENNNMDIDKVVDGYLTLSQNPQNGEVYSFVNLSTAFWGV